MDRGKNETEETKTFEDWCVLYVLEFGVNEREWREGEEEFLVKMSRALGEENFIDTLTKIHEWWVFVRDKSHEHQSSRGVARSS